MSTPTTTPTERQSPPAHLDTLDGLRGLAILMVLLHHFNIHEGLGTLAGLWASLADFLAHGVDLFFALSGFLIFRQLGASRNRPDWLADFWRRRAAKILPTYLACLGFVYLLLPSLLSLTGYSAKLGMQLAAAGNWPWYLAFASNFRNALDGGFTNPALDVSWSLAIEMQFYLLASLLFLGLRERALKYLAWALLLSLCTRTLGVLGGANWVCALALPWNRLDAFAMGALALGESLGAIGRLRAWIIAAVLLLPFVLPWTRTGIFVQTAGYSLVAVACGLALSLSADGEHHPFVARLLRTRTLRWLGALSYSLYLTHIPVRAAVRDLFFKGSGVLGVSDSWIRLAAFCLAAGVACLGVAWLVHVLIEEPLRRRIAGTR